MLAKVDYDAIAQSYDRRYRDNDYSGVEITLRSFVGSGRAPGRVLEVGCGTGHWLRVISGLGLRVAGLDASCGMLQVARIQGPESPLVHGVAEQLPFSDATFDRVFYINAFHHIGDKPRALGEVARVLARGGQVMTVGLDPHVGIDRWYIYDYFEPVLDIDKGRYPATRQIREWMHALRFSDVSTHEIQLLPARLSARESLDNGRLGKGVTSQLSVLTDDEYQRGIERIREDLRAAEARGESLFLCADLRVYATVGTLNPHSAP
jgi:ubiquinone/menaquinone biosynthesis C-methylase UbiE